MDILKQENNLVERYEVMKEQVSSLEKKTARLDERKRLVEEKLKEIAKALEEKGVDLSKINEVVDQKEEEVSALIGELEAKILIVEDSYNKAFVALEKEGDE